MSSEGGSWNTSRVDRKSEHPTSTLLFTAQNTGVSKRIIKFWSNTGLKVHRAKAGETHDKEGETIGNHTVRK